MSSRLILTAGEFLLPCFFFFTAGCLAGCEQTRESAPPNPGESIQSSNSPSRLPAPTIKELLEPDRQGSAAGLSSAIRFRDAADELNIRFSRYNDVVKDRFFLPEVMGGGVGWLDFDLDGSRDLYAVNGCPIWQETASPEPQYQNRLYRKQGLRFCDVTTTSGTGDTRYGQGCSVGDYDADGFPDVFVANYGPNSLLQSNGDGTFNDVTAVSGVGGNEWSTSSVWFDANSDGLNDLYVTNYLNLNRENHQTCKYPKGTGYCGPGGWNGVADRLYLNSGDGSFREQLSDVWGVKGEDAKGLAVIAADFDNDRIPEVYVGNDMMPNFLFKRTDNRDVHSAVFQNFAVVAGCAVSNEGLNEASMGVACADFDGNGLIDIFLTHYYESKNTLYRNLGQMLFEDASKPTRIAATSYDKLGFGTIALDADRDGAEDLFIANGHVLGPNHSPNEMTAQILRNDGKGQFSDISPTCGKYFSELCLGRGAAGADFNDDGRPDIAVSHLDRPLALLQNESDPSGNFLGIELISSNRCHPTGAIVRVHSSNCDRTVSVTGGGSYLSANDTRLLIATGTESAEVTVDIQWPGGRVTEHRQVQTGRYWTLTEFGDTISGPLRRGAAHRGTSHD